MRPTPITAILESSAPAGRVRVHGWVRTRRDAKDFSFIEVNDGSCVANLQIIAPASLASYAATVRALTTGSSVSVEGDVRPSEGRGQKYELLATDITAYGIAPVDYPLQKKHHTFEYLREIAHLRPRTNSIGAVLRLRSGLSFAVHSFFRERGFFYIHTPIVTTSDCEGAGEMFRVTTLDINDPPRTGEGGVDFSRDFFGREAGLTVSGQLEGEICALALGKIYTFGPTFRAENSNTPRHLAEFWMIEPEAAFYRLADDMDLAEAFVRHLARFALDNHGGDLAFFNERIDREVISRLEGIATSPFERITYAEAIGILARNNDRFAFKVSWGSDLQSEHEQYLTEVAFQKPVVVYDYPREIKAFYMRNNDDGKTVAAM
ncbi:MAG: asparagine--tRNA ligase, partial [Chitinispirillaceae bacterium]|nr:asparagine--tRNA ligase [Chitinispirillaceae bacterium]